MCVFFLDGITFVLRQSKKKKTDLPESGYKWHTGYVAQVSSFHRTRNQRAVLVWVSHIAYTSITSREGEASLFFSYKGFLM